MTEDNTRRFGCRTTHHEGCACHEARHAREVAELRARLDEALMREGALREAARSLCDALDDDASHARICKLHEALRKEISR